MNLEPLDLVEQRLRETVDKVTRRDNSITACCPAHNDRNPSLTVSVGDKRDIVLHCFAGCAPDTILQALGLAWKDFAPTEPINQDIHYLYENQDGKPLYRVIRSPGKRFWQQHINPEGEWVNGLGNTPRILYRLPQLLDAKNRGIPIWIVEGEKDVERLRRIGLTATCNSGGAGKFLPQHADTLAGTELNIVADRDEPGRQHAQHIAELCEARNCTIHLWEPAHGKDITDHLAAGYQIHELTPINRNQLDEETQQDPFHVVDWAKFWTGEHLIEQWCIWPLIPAKRTISLYAPAKAGKSTIVLAVIAAAVAGKPILGTQPAAERPRVLYLDYEMTDSDLYERLTELGYTPQDNLEGLAYALIPNIGTLDTDTGAQQVIDKAIQHQADLVVIDTFGRAVAGEENSADTVRTFYRLTAQRLKQLGIALLRTDHAGKDLDKGQRGTSAKNDDVDVVWQLKRTDNGVQLNRTHSRVGWIPQQLDITKHDDDNGHTDYRLTQQKSFPDGTAQVAALLDELDLAIDVSARKALEALRNAGHKARNDKVRAAIQMRRQRQTDPLESLWITTQKPVDNSGRGVGARPPENTRGAVDGRDGAHLQETPREQEKHTGRGNGARSGAADLSKRGAVRHLIGGARPGPAPVETEQEIF